MPRPATLFAAALISLASLSTLGGCQSGGNAAGGASDMTNAVGKLAGDWVLKKIEGADVASLLPAGARPPSLNFGDGGRVSGFGGVNRLAGSLDLDALTRGDFKIGQMISTRMAGPPESMQIEDRFTRLLGDANGFKFGSRDSLSLTRDGTSLLDFVRAGK